MLKNDKVKLLCKRYKVIIIIVVILLVFPLVVGLIYNIDIPQIIAVDSGDLLAYYGTVFGILGSFITYRTEIKKREKEKNAELRPVVLVDVTHNDQKNGLYNIRIKKISKGPLFHWYIYDEYISDSIKDSQTLKVSFNQSVEYANRIHAKYNIAYDDIIDNDNYPKFVNILCEDAENNMWECVYRKITECSNHYYVLETAEIL